MMSHFDRDLEKVVISLVILLDDWAWKITPTPMSIKSLQQTLLKDVMEPHGGCKAGLNK